MGSIWYSVSMQLEAALLFFFSPLSLKINLDFEKSSLMAPAFGSLPGDTHAPHAVANSWASSSAPAAGFCSLEKKSSLARAVAGIKFAASWGAAWGLDKDEACRLVLGCIINMNTLGYEPHQ